MCTNIIVLVYYVRLKLKCDLNLDFSEENNIVWVRTENDLFFSTTTILIFQHAFTNGRFHTRL